MDADTCCLRAVAYARILHEADTGLLADILRIIGAYVVGHNLVKPNCGPSNKIADYIDIRHGYGPTSFDAIPDVKKIIDWKWHTVCNERIYAAIDLRGTRRWIQTKGTVLLLYLSRNRMRCVTGLGPEDEVKVALYLYQYGTQSVKRAICPIYTNALRFN
jgi:hypothetical protein